MSLYTKRIKITLESTLIVIDFIKMIVSLTNILFNNFTQKFFKLFFKIFFKIHIWIHFFFSNTISVTKKKKKKKKKKKNIEIVLPNLLFPQMAHQLSSFGRASFLFDAGPAASLNWRWHHKLHSEKDHYSSWGKNPWWKLNY